MRDIRVGAAQFEHQDGDKAYNLGRIAALTQRAAEQDAEVVSFHECSITGYTFLQTLSREALIDLAEPVPGGASVEALIDVARDHGTIVMAGLVEIDPAGKLYNTYVAVGPQGYITKFSYIRSSTPTSRRGPATMSSSCWA